MAQVTSPSICDKRCHTCAYAFQDSGVASVNNFYCGYLVRTDTLRPCPAGKECTVYKPRKRKKGKG